MMKQNNLLIIFAIILILIAPTVSAFDYADLTTVYSSFTGTMDYILDEDAGNGTGINQSFADSTYLHLNGSNTPMTGNLNFGTYNITNSSCIILTDGEPMCWNTDFYTLDIPSGLGNTIQVGQELTGIGKNNEGSTIYDGQVVYISGVSGEIPLIKLADSSNGSKIHVPAVVTIPFCNNNAVCPVTTFGYVNELDTSMWSEGDLLYISDDGSGNLTNVVPNFPSYNVHIGRVIKVHASTGIILVLPELDMSDGVVLNSLSVINDLNVTGIIYGNSESWNKSGDNVFTASDSYSVGIGINSPVGKLHIIDSSFPVIQTERLTTITGGALTGTTGSASSYNFKTTTSGNMVDGFGGGILFSINDDTEIDNNNFIARIYARRDGADDDGALQFFTLGTNANLPSMTIKSSGLVGIGTTAPVEELHIDKDINSRTRLRLDNQDSGSAAQVGLELNNDAGQALWTFYSSNYVTTALQNMMFFSNGIGGLKFRANTGSNISFGVGSGVADVNDLIIDSNGNVGIGTLNPQNGLDVETNVIIGGALSGSISAPTDGLGVYGDIKAYSNIILSDRLKYENFTIYELPSNSKINGNILSFNSISPDNGDLPRMYIQPGGNGQFSGMVRSWGVINDNESFLNNTNRTDCQTYFDGVGEILKIDCNTSTTGADLFVGDDMQVIGDVWLKNSLGEWRFTTHTLTNIDELTNNLLLSRSNVSLSGTNFTITDEVGESINVVISRNETLKDVSTEWVTLTLGTNNTPVQNFVTYQGSSNPTLTKTTSVPTVDFANVARIMLGDEGNVYASLGGRSAVDEFIRGSYLRWFNTGVLYVSGFLPVVDSTNISIGEGTMTVLLDTHGGVSEVDMIGDGSFLVLNNGTYVQFNSLEDITQYADGGIISTNKYYNLVCGIVHSDVNGHRMMCVVQNEPSSEYVSLSGAETDIYDTVNIFPGNAFLKNLFMPVARMVVQKVAATDEFQTLSNGGNYFDVRGTTSSAGAPATSGITLHNELDNLDYASAGHTGFSMSDDCPAGEFVQNVTDSGVECSAPAGGGTVTSVATDDVYLTGGPITSTGTIAFNETVLNATIDARDTDTTYSAGNGISLAGTTFSVAGNTALTQDADGLSVTNDAIGDTQLTYNTGQGLTITDDVKHDTMNLTGDAYGSFTCLIYDVDGCAYGRNNTCRIMFSPDNGTRIEACN